MITSPTLWPLLPLFGLDRSIGLFWCEEEQRPITHRGSLAFGLASAVHLFGPTCVQQQDRRVMDDESDSDSGLKWVVSVIDVPNRGDMKQSICWMTFQAWQCFAHSWTG